MIVSKLLNNKCQKGLVFVVVLLLVVTVLTIGHKSQAACATMPTDKGTVTSSANVPASGTYYIWSRNKTATASNNGYYLAVDSNCGITVGDANLPTNSWTWVNYQGGNTSNRMSVSLSSGSHTFKFYGLDPSLQVDRLLLTTDSSCIPSGQGDNCVNNSTTPVVVTPTNPNNPTPPESGTIKVGGNTDPNSKTFVKVNGKVIASGNGLVEVDTTKLPDGTHTLVVETFDANGNKHVTLQTIVVKNHYTPWERFYNKLYAFLGHNRLLANLAAGIIVVIALVALGIAAYLAWFWRVWERIPGIKNIHLSFLRVPQFIKDLTAKLPRVPRLPFLDSNPFDAVPSGSVAATGAAQVGTMHHSGNPFAKFFSHPGSKWLVVLVFALVGTATALYSLADTSSFVVEPERGSVVGVTVVTDNTAAGGSYIQFGTGQCPAGQTGTPPNCTTPAPPATCPAGQTGTPPNCVTPPPVSTGGAVPCALTAAAEACWAANTGVQASTGYSVAQIRAGQGGFTKHTGSWTITSPGVYDRHWVEGCIAVKANNVTIKNTLVYGGDRCAGGLQTGGPNNATVSGGLNEPQNGRYPAQNLVLSYVTIDAAGANGAEGDGTTDDSSGLSNGNFVADHLNMQGFAKHTYMLFNATLAESYLHNVSVATEKLGTHIDPIFMWDSKDITIRHNYINAQTAEGLKWVNYQGLGGAVSAAIFSKCGGAHCGRNVVIDKNYISGDSGYALHGSSSTTNTPVGYDLPFDVTNNIFGPSKGPSNAWLTNSVWTNNFYENGQAVPKPQ